MEVRGQLWESVLLFRAGSRPEIELRIIRIGSKHFYRLNLLAGPMTIQLPFFVCFFEIQVFLNAFFMYLPSFWPSLSLCFLVYQDVRSPKSHTAAVIVGKNFAMSSQPY